MSEELTGRRLGHYRIDGVIGRGGMSVMYRATDVRLGRKVALKVIGEHLGGDPEFRERFVDEARNTSAVDHSNVVPLYDFGEVDGLLFIAMRFVDGSDLATLIKDGPISPERTLNLLGQVAEALDNVHGRGLVHLDVKPANVLVTTKEAASEHVYLADFGLTRRGATGHRTRAGDFLGSPTYAAPEHLRGEPVDPRSDAYSLACVLFACLTGRPPYLGKVPAVIQGHLSSDVPSTSTFVVLPGAIDDVLRRGMAKDPRRRFANCRDLMAAARMALAPVAQSGTPPLSSGQGGGGRNGSDEGQQPPQRSGPQAWPSGDQGWPGSSASTGPYSSGPHPQARGPIPQRFSEPVRLRPPVPAGPTAFAARKAGSNRWLIPVLVIVALIIVIVVVFIVVFTSGGDNPGGAVTTSPAASIQVGSTPGSNQLPTKPRLVTSR